MIGWPSFLKLALPIAGGAALAWLVVDHRRLAAVEDDVVACEAAAKRTDRPIEACGKATRAAIETARRATACDAALELDDLYVIRASCAAPVKRVQAERDAARSEAAGLLGQLHAADRERDAAIVRAEARANTASQRKAANDHVLEGAPRGADGRVRCDAECLRRLSGEAGDAQR